MRRVSTPVDNNLRLMNKTRRRKRSPNVDMSAACDVAFLLLMFFVLAAKPKLLEPLNVSMPGYATSGHPDFDSAFATILLGNGKFFLELPDSAMRSQTLMKMSDSYHVKFSQQEVAKFSQVGVIGRAISGLAPYIDNYFSTKDFDAQSGIPFNKQRNELSTWISTSASTYKALYGREIHFAIKADEKAPYTEIKSAIDVLQSQGINKFFLVTNLKSR